MLISEVIRNAIPNASEELCDYILWERTPYPVGEITARSLYSAAMRYHRAYSTGKKLCTFCDRIATTGKNIPVCGWCEAVFSKLRAQET